MVSRRRSSHSDLFTLRVWPEEGEKGHTEWRGKVQHVTSGEARYFRDWETMLAFLLETLDSSHEKDEPKQREEGRIE